MTQRAQIAGQIAGRTAGLVAGLFCALAACGGEPQRRAADKTSAPAPPASAPTSQPAETAPSDQRYQASTPVRLADGSDRYGGELHDELALTPLADILAQPAQYAEKKVKTQGVVKRVCQKMGCWMELTAGEQGPEVRAPMAGHSYFLPQSVVGKQATVEAVVHVRELSEAERAHLEAEGARATDTGVSLEALAVAVR